MARVKQKYNRRAAEARFGHVYERIEGDRCLYCGMPNDGRYDHQPSVYVLHRFADGGLVTKRQIREAFGECRLVPCCTICNMGLGAFHGADDNDRRLEIAKWFLVDPNYPQDVINLILGEKALERRFSGSCGVEIYAFPGVARVVYVEALTGLADGTYLGPHAFPDWLAAAQAELAQWLREAPRRKSQHFLDMAGLASYDLLPHARDDPRGQIGAGEVPGALRRSADGRPY